MTANSSHVTEQQEICDKDEEIESKEDKEILDERDKAKRKAIYRMLWNEIKLEVGNIVVGCVCLIGSTASNAAVPRMFSKLIDQSTSKPSVLNSRNSSARMEKLQIPLIVIGGGLASFLRTTSLKRAEYNITSRLRHSSFAALLTCKPISFFSKSNLDDHDAITPSSVLETDIPTVSQTITTKIAHLLRSCSSVTYSTLTMLKLNPSLLALSVSMVPMLGITAISFSKFINKKKTQFLSLESKIAEFSRERLELDTLSTVKVCDRSKDEISTYQKYQAQTAKLRNEVALAEGCMMGGMFAGTAASIFMVIKAGSSAVRSGKMTTGGLMGFATYSFLLGMGTSGIMKALGEIKLGLKSAERVYDLLQNEVEEGDESNESDKANVDLNTSGNFISFKNVCFSYSPAMKSPHVLQNLNFTIYKNDIIALVGENGAGKSTIAKLLTGLYKPTTGQILVDDLHPLHVFSRAQQNQLIGSVPQESILFDTTLRHNITYANPSASENEIQQAMDQSNSTSFINKIHLDSNPGKRGSKLSGGQRQRIGLARALLSTPKFLILDEPTSHLDQGGESAIEEAVQMARDTSRGVLIITHRKETLSLVDKVIVLKDGCIVEIVEKKKKEEGVNKDVEVDDGWVETGVELTKLIPGLL